MDTSQAWAYTPTPPGPVTAPPNDPHDKIYEVYGTKIRAINNILDHEASGYNGVPTGPRLLDLDASQYSGKFSQMIKFAQMEWQNTLFWRDCNAHKARMEKLDLYDGKKAFFNIDFFEKELGYDGGGDEENKLEPFPDFDPTYKPFEEGEDGSTLGAGERVASTLENSKAWNTLMATTGYSPRLKSPFQFYGPEKPRHYDTNNLFERPPYSAPTPAMGSKPQIINPWQSSRTTHPAASQGTPLNQTRFGNDWRQSLGSFELRPGTAQACLQEQHQAAQRPYAPQMQNPMEGHTPQVNFPNSTGYMPLYQGHNGSIFRYLSPGTLGPMAQSNTSISSPYVGKVDPPTRTGSQYPPPMNKTEVAAQALVSLANARGRPRSATSQVDQVSKHPPTPLSNEQRQDATTGLPPQLTQIFQDRGMQLPALSPSASRSVRRPIMDPEAIFNHEKRKYEQEQIIRRQQELLLAQQRARENEKRIAANEAAERARLARAAKAEQERITHLRDDLRMDPNALAHRYREYLEVFPLGPGENPSPFYTNLLANQQIAEPDDTSDSAKAISYAKERWWNYWEVQDEEKVVELMKKGAPSVEHMLRTNGLQVKWPAAGTKP